MAENLGAVNGVSHEALGSNKKGVFSGRVIDELGSRTVTGNLNDKGVLSDGAGVTEECKVVHGESSSESVTSGIEMEDVELGRSRISNIHNISRNRVVEMPSQDDEWRSTRSVICMVQRLLQGKFGLHYEEDANNFEKKREVCCHEISGNISANGAGIYENSVGKYEDSIDVATSSTRDHDLASHQEEQDALDLDSNREKQDGLCLSSNQEEQEGLDMASNQEAHDGLSLSFRQKELEGLPLASNEEEQEGSALDSSQEEQEALALASNEEEQEDLALASNEEEQEALALGSNKEEQEALALGSNQEEQEDLAFGSNQVEQEGLGLDSYQAEQEGLDLASNQEEQDDEMESIQVTNATDGALIPKTRGEHDKTEKDGEYYIADLVWGKVRGHPWWPGLIFVPYAASDRAKRYFKRDSYLIAYLGDQSFAWNEASKIKPFQMFFSEMENQGTGERFSRAVDSALNEFARRIELGLSCRCLPSEFCEKIKSEVIENSGIRKESSMVSGGDNLSTAALFQPGELVQSIQLFAESPLSNASRLQFMRVKAQLSTFNKYRFNGQLPVLEQFDTSLDDESLFTVRMEQLNSDKANLASEVAVAVSLKKRKSTNQGSTSRKRRHQSNAEANSRMEENYLSNLMPLNSTLQNGGNKLAVKIKRVASSKNPRKPKMVPAKIPVLDVVFKNLTLAAKSPIKEHHMMGTQIHRFLRQFRSAVCIGEPWSRKRKAKQLDNMQATSTADSQPMEESYSTDRLVEGSQDHEFFGPKTLHKCDMNAQTGASDDQVLFESGIHTEGAAKVQPDDAHGVVLDVNDSKQGQKASIRNMVPETSSSVVDGYPKEHSNPTALTLHFADSDSIPSIATLNEVFRCYGPLDELGTKIISERKIAKVVFKSRVDAETTYISNEKYATLGPSLVNCSLDFAPQAL